MSDQIYKIEGFWDISPKYALGSVNDFSWPRMICDMKSNPPRGVVQLEIGISEKQAQAICDLLNNWSEDE